MNLTSGALHLSTAPGDSSTGARANEPIDHLPFGHRFDDVVFCNGRGPKVMLPLIARSLAEQGRSLLR